MAQIDVNRLWKDDESGPGLSDAERAMLPADPAGIVGLNDADLSNAAGGTDIQTKSRQLLTDGCCETVMACGGSTRSLVTIACDPAIELDTF